MSWDELTRYLLQLAWQQPPVRARRARASDAWPGLSAELEWRVLREPQARRRPLHTATGLALVPKLIDAACDASAAEAYVVHAYGLAVDGAANITGLEMIDHQIICVFAEKTNGLSARGAQADVDAILTAATVCFGQLHHAGTAVHCTAAIFPTTGHQQLLRGLQCLCTHKTVHWMV